MYQACAAERAVSRWRIFSENMCAFNALQGRLIWYPEAVSKLQFIN